LDMGVVSEDCAILLEIQGLTLRIVRFLRDVEEDDVAELLPRDEGGELAADVSGSDKGDLLACAHGPASSTEALGAEALSLRAKVALESFAMIDKETVAGAIERTLEQTHLDALGKKYEGKVRDNYTTADGRRFIVVTDRISAFDRVLGTLPLKGQVLN